MFFSSTAILRKKSVLSYLLPNSSEPEGRDKAQNLLPVLHATAGKNQREMQAGVLFSHMARARWRPIRTRSGEWESSESHCIYNCSSPGPETKPIAFACEWGENPRSNTCKLILVLKRRGKEMKVRSHGLGEVFFKTAVVFESSAQKCIAPHSLLCSPEH